MKKLPMMYHNKITRNIENNEKIYSSMDNDKKDDSVEFFDIDRKIKNIFNHPDYIYKVNVSITTNSGVLNKVIIGKNNDNLITIDNEYIPISSIIDISKNK